MVDFARLKNTNDLAKLQAAVEKQTKKKNEDNPDEYWQPTLDKEGNGSAKVRLLPAPEQDGEDALPWVMYWRYSFKANGGWYINKSLATIEMPDPCAEYTAYLWATKLDANIKEARKKNRQVTYEVNVEILQDPGCPENEGLVRKYKFGKKLFAKIDSAMKGTEDKAGFNPFNLYTGADFRIKIKQVATNVDGEQKKFPNYDDSYFLEPSPRSDDDVFLEKLWKQCFSLQEAVNPKSFKTYDQLLKDLTRALGFNPQQPAQPTVKVVERDMTVPKQVEIASKVVETPPWENPNEEETEFNMDFFKKLAE